MNSIRVMPTKLSRVKNAFALSPDRKSLLTTKPPSTRHVQQSTLSPRTTNYAPRTAFQQPHIPHPTSHIPLPTPSVIPDERRQPRDLGSRPSHQPAVTVLRIDSAIGHMSHATGLMSRRCIIPSPSYQPDRSLCFRLWIPARAGLRPAWLE